MSFVNRLRLMRIASVVLVTTVLIAPAVRAQERATDSIERLRRVPPKPNLVEKRQVEFDLMLLRWQIQRGEMTRQRLEVEIARIRHEIERKQANESDAVLNSMPAQLRFATDAVREELIGQILHTLLNAELEIAANQALIERLEQQIQGGDSEQSETQRSALRKKIFEDRERALWEQLEMSREALNRTEELAKNAQTAQSHVSQARIAVKKLEGEFAELRLEKEFGTSTRSSELAERLANSRLETHRLRAQRDAAAEQLERLAKAAEVARELRPLQREIDQLTERLILRVRRLEEVTMETEELRLLLKQVEDAMKQDAKPIEADEGETPPDR